MMDIYLKVTTGVLIAAFLGIVLTKQRSDVSILLILAVCCMAAAAAISYLRPILDFAHKLTQVGELEEVLLETMLKVVGIGLVSQIAGFVCTDAGFQSLSKILQVLTTAVILCISVPVLEEMLSLLEKILGEL